MKQFLQLRRYRLIWGTWCLALLLISGQWRLQSDETPPTSAVRVARNELTPQVPYAVPTFADATAVVDLSLEEGERYSLIVSSLGNGEDRFRVQLSASAGEPPTTGGQRRPGGWGRDFASPQSSVQSLGAAEATDPSHPDGRLHIEPPSSREFFIHVAEGDLADRRRYAKIDAALVKSSPTVLIYWDRQFHLDDSYRRLVDDVAMQYESEIVPEVARRLGGVYDTDGDGRFTILFTPWLDRLEGGRTSLRGMVRGADFRNDVPPPFGHRCDMLYLNPLASPAVPWRDILLHESTHAVCCSWRMQCGESGRPLPVEEDWIQEGIAHAIEPLGANLAHRVDAFLAAPHECPLVISDYYHAGLWRNDGCRGATALFHRWLAERYGDELLRAIMLAPSRGTKNIEAVTGCRFDDFFRAWTIDLRENASAHTWNVEREGPAIELRGTAAAYWELTAERPLRRHICIEGERGCRLQVTVLRIAE